MLVPGDVNSTLAASLVASKLGIPVGHVEAGLRSFDRTMPEEINRIVADAVSDLLFIHSPEAVDNLLREGVAREKIHAVGNTMIDTLVAMRGPHRGARRRAAARPERGSYLVVTLHRPALVDGPLLPTPSGRCSTSPRAAGRLPGASPHAVRRSRPQGLAAPDHERLRLLEPVGYLEFLSLVHGSAGVLTDSGGIQEETTFLGIPCFTLRDNTERPVTVHRRHQHAARPRP